MLECWVSLKSMPSFSEIKQDNFLPKNPNHIFKNGYELEKSDGNTKSLSVLDKVMLEKLEKSCDEKLEIEKEVSLNKNSENFSNRNNSHLNMDLSVEQIPSDTPIRNVIKDEKVKNEQCFSIQNLSSLLDSDGGLLHTTCPSSDNICLKLVDSTSELDTTCHKPKSIAKSLSRDRNALLKKVRKRFKSSVHKKAKRVKCDSLTPEMLGIPHPEDFPVILSDSEKQDIRETQDLFECLLSLPYETKLQCLIANACFQENPHVRDMTGSELNDYIQDNFSHICNKIQHVTTTNTGRVIATAVSNFTVKAYQYAHVAVKLLNATADTVYEIHDSLIPDTHIMNRLCDTHDHKVFEIVVVNNTDKDMKIKRNQQVAVGNFTKVSGLGEFYAGEDQEKVQMVSDVEPEKTLALTKEQIKDLKKKV